MTIGISEALDDIDESDERDEHVEEVGDDGTMVCTGISLW
jgi:hypothetical protein